MSSGDEDSPIPSVNERLGQLRPSRELLEYYRKKVAEFDNEHDEMLKKLDDYRVCLFFFLLSHMPVIFCYIAPYLLRNSIGFSEYSTVVLLFVALSNCLFCHFLMQ